MTKAGGPKTAGTHRAIGPINEVDGIPDRAPRRSPWKILLIAGVFLAWLAFLIYCQVAGSPSE